MTDREKELRQVNKNLTAENAQLKRELDEVAKRAAIETEVRFWRACYEELIDKVMKGRE